MFGHGSVFGHVWAFLVIYLVDPRKKVDLYKWMALDGHVQTLLGMTRHLDLNEHLDLTDQWI